MASSSSRSVKVTDLNPHLLCVLCGGYYVDATTIIECLHSFCKSCIVRYLETNKYCPICDVQVHKSKPLLNIRSDRKLQAIVYKLVPGLFQRELKCRKEFYKNQLESKINSTEKPAVEESPVFSSEETLLLGVRYADSSHQDHKKRYFRCPAAITVSLLQKLMRAKFDLNVSQRVEFIYEGDLLPDHMSLMDLAYMYHWTRKQPVELEYRLLECQQKKMKLSYEEDMQVSIEEKQTRVECEDKGPVVCDTPAVTEEPDREVQLQISENGVMSVQSVDSSSNNTIVSSKSDCVSAVSETSVPVKDIQLETMELMKSLGNDVTLNFDSTLPKSAESEMKSNCEIPTNNNTIKNEKISDDKDHKHENCTKDSKEDTRKTKDVSEDVKNYITHTKESMKDSTTVNNNEFGKIKSHTNNSSLTITAIPPVSSMSTPVHAQKVYPGAVKDASNPSRYFKTKEVQNDIKRLEVTIKPTLDKHEPPKSTSTARYKTLKAPIKPWNPAISRSAVMAMKQAQAANQEKCEYPGKPAPKAPKFFKLRNNVPRYLGNPASGVKPMYQVLPGSELMSQAPQTSVSQTSKPMTTNELTVMKIDPKTLNPIPISHSRSSKLNSSSSKPSTTFAPSQKPSERDLLNCGTPIRNPVSKSSSSMSLRAPSQVHPPSFPSNPFGLPSHILYPGFPRPFSQVDTSGNQLPADSQILRAMSMLCSPGAAFHPSLPPSISMLFNPHHPHHRSTNDKLNFKYSPSDFHKATTTTTPSVQRIPASGPSSKISSSPSNSLTCIGESFGSTSILKELDKHLAEEKSEHTSEELGRSTLFSPSNDLKFKSAISSSNTDRDSLQNRVGKISPLPITNGLSVAPRGGLDKDLLKLNNHNASGKISVKESTEQSIKDENQRADSKNASESNC